MFEFDDGGRAAAGYKGQTGDCGTRALAIATRLDYQQAYDMVIEYAKRERPGARKKKKRSHPRTGIWVPTMKRILSDLDWEWTATMGIGTGCTVHYRPDELPSGTVIVRVTRHYSVMVDGVIRDTHDPSRDGTRCVYGYWRKVVAV